MGSALAGPRRLRAKDAERATARLWARVTADDERGSHSDMYRLLWPVKDRLAVANVEFSVGQGASNESVRYGLAEGEEDAECRVAVRGSIIHMVKFHVFGKLSHVSPSQARW